MGSILVHEFMTLDGVVDAPTWSNSTVTDVGRGHRDRRNVPKWGTVNATRPRSPE